MKKLLLVLLVAGSLAACNNGSDKKDGDKTDSTKMADSSKMSTDSTKK